MQVFSKKQFKTAFLACTALTIVGLPDANAKLAIMGTLDTRAPFVPNTYVPHSQKIKSNTPSVKQNTQVIKPSIHAPTEKLTQKEPLATGAFSANEIGLNRQLNIITARGDVEIIHDGQILIADVVNYNQNSDIVTASGNVQIIQSNGDVIVSEHVEISSDLKDGIIKTLHLNLADNSQLKAKQARRKAGRFLIAEDVEYSPCQKCADDPDRPLTWKITANEVTHDQEQRRLEYSDVLLKVYDVPVFYVPYFTHPDPTRKRESGFLTPSFGSRGSLKSFVTTPYFWNISPSKDLTLEPTYYYNLEQPHLNAEYRQISQNGEVRLGGSLTYADGGAGSTDVNEEEFRGHIDSEALFDLNNTWRWGVDLNHATDETYTRRYGQDDRSTNSHLVSEIFTEGFRKQNYMKASINSYQELRDITSENLQNGKAEFEFSHKSTPQAAGSFWKLDGGLYGISRKNDTISNRLSVDGSWNVPYTSSDGDLIMLSTNLTTTGYYISDYNSSDLSDEYSGFQGRVVPSATLEWRKPLSRTNNSATVNEIFEPIIKLKAAPNVGDNHKIPNEDSQDFEFDDTNLFKTNRFTGIDKNDGGQRVDFGFNYGMYGANGGFSQLFVGQSYRLRDDDTYDSNSGHEDNISDIVGRVEVNPSDFLSLLYRFRLDKNDMTLNRSETELSMGPASTRFSLGYLSIEGTGDSSEFISREEINATLNNQITKNWYSKLDGRYRMSNPEGSVTYGGQIGYLDECVNVFLDFRRSFSEDRDIDPNDAFTLRFELKNLGGFSTF